MVNLSYERYYGSRRARLISSFMMNGVHHTRVHVTGEKKERVVLTADLTEEPNFDFKQSVDIVLSKSVENHEVATEEVSEPEPVEDVEVFKDEKVEEVEETTTHEAELNVVAISKTGGEEHILGLRDQLSTNETVKKLALDPAAIERVLDGEQQSHKGFTFELREV